MGLVPLNIIAAHVLLDEEQSARTIAHVMCLVWFLGWARHQDVVRRPALFLDRIILDDNDDDD